MTLFAVLVLVVGALTATGLARLGAAELQRARAEALADVTALAAVQAGTEGASAVARANDATLRRAEVRADASVEVEIVRRGAVASATAAPRGEVMSGDPDPGVGRR